MSVFSALILAALRAAAPPASQLVISPCDAGEHYQFETVTCPIELKNIGNKAIRISESEARKPWDSIEPAEVVVSPHSTAYLTASVALQDSIGYTRRSFRFVTDEPGQAFRGSNVTAFVLSTLDDRAPTVDFGTVDLHGAMPSRSIKLGSREVRDFKILEILSKPNFVDVEITDSGKGIQASLRADAPWGVLHHEKIKLRVTGSSQREAWINVDGDLHGDVVPDSNPLSLGLMRTGNKNRFLIRLTSPTGKNFRLGSIELDGLNAKTTERACQPKKDGCVMIELAVSDKQPLGRVEGIVKVGLPDFHRNLPIGVVGMILTPAFPIHDFQEESEKAKAEAGDAISRAPSARNVDIGGDIKRSVAQTDNITPEGRGPLVRWSVANQAPIYGYIVYRSDNETGPFLRVNKEIVRTTSKENSQLGVYSWRDTGSEPGRTYWYYVGLVKNDGSKTQLTGPQKAVAK